MILLAEEKLKWLFLILLGDNNMEIVMHHQTAHCPNCKKDTYISEMIIYFDTVECPWCGQKFNRKGKIIKTEKEKK